MWTYFFIGFGLGAFAGAGVLLVLALCMAAHNADLHMETPDSELEKEADRAGA